MAAIVVPMVVIPIVAIIISSICAAYWIRYMKRKEQGSAGKSHTHVLCKIIAVHYSTL